MRISTTSILIAAVVSTAPSQAQLIEYQFTGTVTESVSPVDASLPAVRPGDPFSGSWSVEVDQPGQTIVGTPRNDGRQYDLATLSVILHGESIALDGGVVYVSEGPVDPAYVTSWPSGFSSDYAVVSVASPSLPRWNADIWRVRLFFSYDGLGIGNSLTLPEGFDFLSDPVTHGIAIDSIEGWPAITGRIDSVAAVTVPIPSSMYLLGAAAMLVFSRRGRRDPGHVTA